MKLHKTIPNKHKNPKSNSQKRQFSEYRSKVRFLPLIVDRQNFFQGFAKEIPVTWFQPNVALVPQYWFLETQTTLCTH